MSNIVYSGDISIPFGMSEDNQIETLKLTQRYGQNAALIIGNPGTGKSILLQTLILNASKKYTSDELNMYLIDFSGTELNRYHKLPHVKEIVSEATRDRGVSVLDALYLESIKRIELCRTYGANSILELKADNPSLNIPFLLLIVDEFENEVDIKFYCDELDFTIDLDGYKELPDGTFELKREGKYTAEADMRYSDKDYDVTGSLTISRTDEIFNITVIGDAYKDRAAKDFTLSYKGEISSAVDR